MVRFTNTTMDTDISNPGKKSLIKSRPRGLIRLRAAVISVSFEKKLFFKSVEWLMGCCSVRALPLLGLLQCQAPVYYTYKSNKFHLILMGFSQSLFSNWTSYGALEIAVTMFDRYKVKNLGSCYQKWIMVCLWELTCKKLDSTNFDSTYIELRAMPFV